MNNIYSDWLAKFYIDVNEPVNSISSTADSDNEICQMVKLSLLKLVIDGQASAGEVEKFKQHIANCDYCNQKFQLENTIKNVLIKNVAEKSVPCNLLDSIKLKIRQTTD